MPDFTFASNLRQGSGGAQGSDGIRYILPTNALFTHSQFGSIWFVGHPPGTGYRDEGAHAFDLRSLDLSGGKAVTRVRFQSTLWYTSHEQSAPGPVYTEGPRWAFHYGHNIYIDPQYGLGDLFAVKNFGIGNVLWDVTDPMPGWPHSIDVDLPPAWIDPTKEQHALEVEDVSVYASGYRYYIFMSAPIFTQAQLVVTVAPPVSTISVGGGRREVFEVEGGRSLSHEISAGRRQVHAGDGGRRSTHSLVGGRRKVFDAEGGRGR